MGVARRGALSEDDFTVEEWRADSVEVRALDDVEDLAESMDVTDADLRAADVGLLSTPFD